MTTSISESILNEAYRFFMATRAELFLFFVAVGAYLLLFGNIAPTKHGKGARPKAKSYKIEEEDDEEDLQTKDASILSTQEVSQLENSFQSAFDANDHRQVIRCWSSLRRSEHMPNISVAHAVESMQRFKKDANFVVRELKGFFKRHRTECDNSVLNELLESLSKRLDAELVERVLEMMPTTGLQLDARGYELVLTMHFTTRNFAEVRAVLAEMEARKVAPSTKSTIVAVKMALKTGQYEEAARHFKNLKSLWSGSGATASTAPRHLVSQLVDLACKDRHLREFLPLLDGVPISEDAVNSMLSECIRAKDPALTEQVEKLVRYQGHELSDSTYMLLVKSQSNDSTRVQALFEEAMAKNSGLSADFALTLLAFCGQTHNVAMADRLFEYMKPRQIPVLSAFIRFYTESEQFGKACDVYEQHMKGVQPAANSEAADGQPRGSSSFLDARIERSLMAAALRCGRNDLAKTFLDASPSDVAKHITMIRNCAASGNLHGAMRVFESLQKSGAEVNSVVYNTVLDACVESRDLKAAEAWMQKTKEAGMLDVVSYNTLIKSHLQSRNFDKARGLMEEMRKEGLQPNRVTFNELVNGLVTCGTPAQRAEVWGIVKEMREAGVKPNQVTCSILLKSLNKWSSESAIHETMELITAMDEPMDEVLLSSVVEACVRIGKPDLLAAKLKQFQTTDSLAVNGSHTFGSLIKAYGHAKDIDGVWRCWKEMRSRHIRPTSITLGCMVEAVVTNGDTEGAFELIHQMQEDDRCREALNAVIYCSVLKGFCREKKIQRVWCVYEEMLQRNVELSIVTYNTLLDACARCGRMDRTAAIMEDLKSKHISANLITYSTLVKGHCQAGDIERGFAIMRQMQTEAKLKPDEIMYNSLLDGCAQNNLMDEGLSLLESMQEAGVHPSNFTLSLLVKLMNRCRKLDGAFKLVDDITTRYHFKCNVHVFTNLIQACIANRQLQRGVTTFQQMLSERVRPENRTYCILVRASLTHNNCDQAVAFLRAALWLGGSAPIVPEAQASLASFDGLDHALVSEVLQALVDKGRVQDLAVPLLGDLRSWKPQVRVDSGVQRSVMSAGVACHAQPGEAAPQQQRAAPRHGGGNRGARDNARW